MNKQLTYEQILYRFLKHHRAYSKYIRNCNFTFDHYSQQRTFVQDMMQLCGFEWDQTPEGGTYWANLSSKWRELCKSLNIGRHVYA